PYNIRHGKVAPPAPALVARDGGRMHRGESTILSRLQCHAAGVSFFPALRCSGTSTMGANHFGARVARLEDPALLTGRGRFVDDILMPGALHACFVRAPHAHARIRAIDVSAARAMAGVHAALTADDLPARMAT